MNTEQIVTEQLIDLINKYLSNNKLQNYYYYKAFNKAYCCYQNLNNKILIAEKKQSKDYYQLDILICKDTEKLSEVEPLVIIEVKNKGYTSHDIIVYSDKAKRHKILYPHIKYGFVVINSKQPLSYKYFSHAENFDFAYLLDVDDKHDVGYFIENILVKEIEDAEYRKKLLYSKTRQKLKGYRLNFEKINS